jgi:lysophospholipid acyltransferase (LPLAT)-like uncharacterized protein
VFRQKGPLAIPWFLSPGIGNRNNGTEATNCNLHDVTTFKTLEPSKSRSNSPSRRRFRILRRRIGSVLLPMLAPPLLRLLSKSWQVEVLQDGGNPIPDRDGSLFAIWHGRMLVGLPNHRDWRLTVLVSPSDDGSLISTLLHRFGYDTVRGSSNKGGARALRELTALLEGGARIVITPDGPRGPRHSMNSGLAWMARATASPVFPCGLVCDRAWHLRSWDQFTIPKFRARIAVVYGPELRLDAQAGEEDQAAFTDRIRSELIAAEERGFRYLGIAPDF